MNLVHVSCQPVLLGCCYYAMLRLLAVVGCAMLKVPIARKLCRDAPHGQLEACLTEPSGRAARPNAPKPPVWLWASPKLRPSLSGRLGT